MYSRIIATIITGSLLVSCGTISRGTTDEVHLMAQPPEAEISTSLGHRCKSPCTVTVERKTDFIAYAEYPGYKRGTIVIKSKVTDKGAAGFAGNVLVGGVIGMGVDAATGAAKDHYPNPAEIILEPIDASNPKTPPQKSFYKKVHEEMLREKKTKPTT